MKFWPKLIFINLSLVLSSSYAESSNSFSLGEAFSLEDEKLLYREAHCPRNYGLQREVFYFDPQGESIAHKSLDYRHGSATPAFVQHNYQTDEKTGVRFKQSDIELFYRDNKGVIAEKSLDLAQQKPELPIVVDAGFDSFIRKHWDSLIAGENRQFRFALPTRGQLVDLRVSTTSCSYASERDQCFAMAMDNWLFRMLVDDIELGYDPESRQLTRYRGLSNIEDADGNGIAVDIRYSYQDLPSNTCVITSHSLDSDKRQEIHG